MIRREDLLLKVNDQDGDLEPTTGYSVVVNKSGAVANGGSVVGGGLTSFGVYAGHGFEVGDAFILNLDESTFGVITELTSATVIVGTGHVNTVAGDVLINLGTDTGGVAPNYDGSEVEIFEVPSNGATPITDSTVTVSATGEYGYWHETENDIWELILDTDGDPVDFRMSANSGALDGPTSSTDKAVAIFSGTGGRTLQNSVVIINAGAVSGITTLATSGAITGGSTITATTSLAATTSLSVGTSATIGTTLGVTGATTLSSTLGVTGAATLSSTLGVTGATTLSSTLAVSGAATLSSTLAVTGTLTTSTHATIGGHLARSVTAGITASTTQSQGQGALTSDINEISVCANANDTVTMPAAVAGRAVTIIHNGAQTLRIYPASGDTIAGGIEDASTTQAAASNKTYVAFNSTAWELLS